MVGTRNHLFQLATKVLRSYLVVGLFWIGMDALAQPTNLPAPLAKDAVSTNAFRRVPPRWLRYLADLRDLHRENHSPDPFGDPYSIFQPEDILSINSPQGSALLLGGLSGSSGVGYAPRIPPAKPHTASVEFSQGLTVWQGKEASAPASSSVVPSARGEGDKVEFSTLAGDDDLDQTKIKDAMPETENDTGTPGTVPIANISVPEPGMIPLTLIAGILFRLFSRPRRTLP